MKLSNNEFYFESDSLGTDGFCKRLIVELELDFAKDIEDCHFQLSISDEAGKAIELESLPEDEQKRIEYQAQGIFDDIIGSEHAEHWVCAAEDWADSREDR